MRLSTAIICLAGLSLMPLVASAGDPASRPNVIFIFSDDQGTVDLNCYGAKDLYTPHLDALAKRGVRFTQFYSAAPVCSPSRGALLTGRYPQRCGVPGNVGIGTVGLPDAEHTIAERLQQADYRTSLVGKWHLGKGAGLGPRGQGFDEFFGHWKGCIDNYSHFFYWSGPNVHDLWRNEIEIFEDGRHFGDLMVREALAYIERNRERPFFLYLPFNIPHYPLQGQARFREMYQDLESPRKHYAALVSTLDEKVGQIVGKVEALGLRRKTLIIFQSDHGHSTEVRTMGGGGSAGPYRGSKFSLLEGGIRVPAIASYPGVIPEGEVRDQLAVSVDWYPTICELAGVDLPIGLDGRSLVKVLKHADAPATHSDFHWQSGGDQWAVRSGPWKLVHHARAHKSRLEGDDLFFLSHMARDATERKNLAKEHPEEVERLKKLHQDWLVDLRASRQARERN